LWLLVGLAALGGLVGLVRPAPAAPRQAAQTEAPYSIVSDAWAAAGFGSRTVAAYLGTDDRGEGGGDFAGFLGDGSAPPGRLADGVPQVAVVAVERAGEHYWAVTTAARGAGGEEFWQVGVANRRGRLVATGLPTPIGAPPVADRPELAVAPSETPPADDPVVETVRGWVEAYACGQGDVSPWLAPGVHMSGVTPPLCSGVRLDRWGTQSHGEHRLVVVTEATLDRAAPERRVAFALSLARRDGRWEVAELLPALPLSEEVEG
jgi:hypothetical protein